MINQGMDAYTDRDEQMGLFTFYKAQEMLEESSDIQIFNKEIETNKLLNKQKKKKNKNHLKISIHEEVSEISEQRSHKNKQKIRNNRRLHTEQAVPNKKYNQSEEKKINQKYKKQINQLKQESFSKQNAIFKLENQLTKDESLISKHYEEFFEKINVKMKNFNHRVFQQPNELVFLKNSEHFYKMKEQQIKTQPCQVSVHIEAPSNKQQIKNQENKQVFQKKNNQINQSQSFQTIKKPLENNQKHVDSMNLREKLQMLQNNNVLHSINKSVKVMRNFYQPKSKIQEKYMNQHKRQAIIEKMKLNLEKKFSKDNKNSKILNEKEQMAQKLPVLKQFEGSQQQKIVLNGSEHERLLQRLIQRKFNLSNHKSNGNSILKKINEGQVLYKKIRQDVYNYRMKEAQKQKLLISLSKKNLIKLSESHSDQPLKISSLVATLDLAQQQSQYHNKRENNQEWKLNQKKVKQILNYNL